MYLRLTLSIAMFCIAIQTCDGQEQKRGARPVMNPTPLNGGTLIAPSIIGLDGSRGPSELAQQALAGFAKQAEGDADAAEKARVITHQPLIHIKVRVVEVQRANGLSASSILEYISTDGVQPTLTTGAPSNGGFQNSSGITNFGVPGLINGTAGTGALFNLTSQHINWVASLLATEFNADTITAPQLTTLNGQKVEFRAGQNIPFEFGASRFQQNLATVQQFQYADVGAYVSVTPVIVNWGENDHAGLGNVKRSYATEADSEKTKFVVGDLKSLPVVLEAIAKDDEIHGKLTKSVRNKLYKDFSQFETLDKSDKDNMASLIVDELNKILDFDFTRSVLAHRLENSVLLPQAAPIGCQCEGCSWKASDCTIDLSIAVRLSEAGVATIDEVDGDGNVVTRSVTSQDNIRNIGNVVQVKSGHGVVLGGLITMSDADTVSKVPIIGDIPLVGAIFRSKNRQRVKTETIIFVEAEVLPGFDDECSGAVEDITSRDFVDGRVQLQCDLRDSWMRCGLNQSGLTGQYLPTPSKAETEYWNRYHQTIRNQRHRSITTEVIDIFGK